MFTRSTKSNSSRLLVSVVCTDADLARRVSTALDRSGRYHAETVTGPVTDAKAGLAHAGFASLQILEIPAQDRQAIAFLEQHMRGVSLGTRVIVLSTGLAEESARRLIKLGIADWLPVDSSDAELLTACDQALEPAGGTSTGQAHCTAFMSAIGGAGATTLAIAAAVAQSGGRREAPIRTCVVDLDLQHGTLAEYLDLAPALQLSEVTSRPDRLDRHLLEIMLSRHASGLAILSAPATLSGPGALKGEGFGQLLDLASANFDQLVIDLPSCWKAWCEDIVRGLDQFYIVTVPTVAGLRQARRLAEMVREGCGMDMSGTVIVNRSRRFGANVSRGQARDALGSLLAGYVTDAGGSIGHAQDRGQVISVMTPRARIVREVGGLIAERAKRKNGMTSTERIARK